VTTFSQLLAAQPGSPDAMRLLGKAQLASGNAVAAIVLLGKAMNLAPGNVDVLVDLAEAELAAGRAADALKTIRVAQSAAPGSARPFVVAGDILLAQGKAEEANQAYRQALERRRGGDVAMRMHLALEQLGENGQATQLLSQWVKSAPEDFSVRSYFGSYLLQQGKYREAAAELEAVLRQRPKDANVLNNLAWALAQLNDPRAREYAEAALRENGNDPAILDTLGSLLVRDGQPARAVELLERALSIDPNTHVRYHLAQAYMRAGNSAGARRELERLLADPKFTAKEEAKKRLAELL
jgi:putative PEP-CTERM system TPR-repeat lipoprotein